MTYFIHCRYLEDKIDTAPGATKKLKLNNNNKRDYINQKSSVSFISSLFICFKHACFVNNFSKYYFAHAPIDMVAYLIWEIRICDVKNICMSWTPLNTCIWQLDSVKPSFRITHEHANTHVKIAHPDHEFIHKKSWKMQIDHPKHPTGPAVAKTEAYIPSFSK